MAQTITSFEDLVSQEFKSLSMGIRPSGKVHLGSLITLLSGLLYMKEHPETRFEIQVMDLDYDFNRGPVFTPYLYLAGPEGSGQSAREYLRGELATICEVAADELRTAKRENIRVLYFSEFLMDREALNFFTDILTDPERLGAMTTELFDENKKGKVPVSGICPGCHTSVNGYSSPRFARSKSDKLIKKLARFVDTSNPIPEAKRIERIEVCNQELQKITTEIDVVTGGRPVNARYFMNSSCYNQACIMDQYAVDLRQPGTYNIHFMVDPIRDALQTSARLRNDLHIFGGDYANPTGERKVPRVLRIQRAMEAIGLKGTDAYIGPLVLAEGKKMGKSLGNGSIVKVQDEKNLRRTIQVLSEMIHENHREIDYKEIERRIGTPTTPSYVL